LNNIKRHNDPLITSCTVQHCMPIHRQTTAVSWSYRVSSLSEWHQWHWMTFVVLSVNKYSRSVGVV